MLRTSASGGPTVQECAQRRPCHGSGAPATASSKVQ
ncbi:hypothetical protein Celaphus_00011544 [Cervus elaphus hippelaphus]|uniref:Uncharacterized protein n=1 Tax=Cervus elaphus hippelaphus TaxID=46360 RepID=A0A212DFA0_CEREH|nr:hypothetical protein Celaphus_00011544 [Cervus elaphus hippelaphus]